MKREELRSGWFGVRCSDCRKYAPVMEESDLCQECHDALVELADRRRRNGLCFNTGRALAEQTEHKGNSDEA
jgi:hypothetical protein